MLKNCVFIHLPRTGGSSIWHSLVATAAGQKRGICDIYHETRKAFGGPVKGAQLVTTLRQRIGDMPCLFHHHTDEAILDCFSPGESALATVLRDPVDRFVSEVFHSRGFLQSCTDRDFVAYHERHWGRSYVRALLDSRIKSKQLLDVAATVRFFHNYYTKYFSSLLGFRQSSDKLSTDLSGSYLRLLADAIRAQFDTIGLFEDLQSEYSNILTAFELGDGSERLDRTINMAANRRRLPASDQRRYRRHFRSDYALLNMLCAQSSRHRTRFETRAGKAA